MRLQRIPQRVSNLLAPVASSFTCPQGQHFRIFCWLLVTLRVIEGGASLKALTRSMPPSLAYWTVLRMLRSGYWAATGLVTQLGTTVARNLPPPADGVLHLTGDLTVVTKTGEHQPLTRKSRLNGYAPYIFGQSLVLLIAQWGRWRIPVEAGVVDPTIKGHQNILFRDMLAEFVPPAWTTQVIVSADAADCLCRCCLCRQSDTQAHPAERLGLCFWSGAHLEAFRRHVVAQSGPAHAEGLLSSSGFIQPRSPPQGLLGLSPLGLSPASG